jgi:pathogenesis-related protein 1
MIVITFVSHCEMRTNTKSLRSSIVSLTILIGSINLFSQDIPANTGSRISQQDAQKVLNYHNEVRKKVGSPNLKWSPDLARYAQAWADQLSETCKMKHRPTSGQWKQQYGENIFWASNHDYTVLDACENWYEEIEFFKPGKLTEKVWSKAGHYTQMVWKETTHVGIGKAICKNGGMIIVANYNPAGNYIGEKPY